MKIENKIKYNRLKEALIRWVLEGGRVLDAIPWGEEIESVIHWEDVSDRILDSIGSRTDKNGKLWDAAKILTNPDELERFHNFITEKMNKVMTVYQGIIDKANKLGNARFEIIIHKFISVKKSVAKYGPIHHYFGNNLTTLANEVYDKLKVCDWKNDDFIDAVHFALYNNTHITFSSNYLDELYLHLEVKKCVEKKQ